MEGSDSFEELESYLLSTASDNYALDLSCIERLKVLASDDRIKLAKAYYFEALYLFYRESNLKGTLSALGCIPESHAQLLPPIYRAKIKNLSGAAYSYLGEIHTAKSLYSSAAEILLNSPHGIEEYKLLSLVYLNLHQINLSTGTPKLDYLHQAMRYAEKSKDSLRLANCYNGYGRVYFIEGKYTEAIQALELARTLYAKESGRMTMLTHSNLGMVYVKLGDRIKAQQQFKIVEENLKIFPDAKSEAVLYMQYGLMYSEFGDFDLALEAYNKSLHINERIGYMRGICDNYNGLESMFEKQGDFSKAYKYLKLKNGVEKAMLNSQNSTNVSRSLYEYELDQKSQEVEMLKNLNNELNQFAYIASHDLREPLRMISMYADLLKRNIQNKNIPEVHDEIEYLQEIKTASNRMNGLIFDLLQFTKISAEVNMEEINLEETIKTVIKSLQPVFPEKNIRISYENLPNIFGVKSHILQLFQNLISNSIKHNLNEQVLIRISADIQAEALHIIVSDNGIGVPEEYREKVFKLFQRLNNSSSGSTGIGLAICKKIIDLMGGNIWIESNDVHGSDFNIKLPLTDSSKIKKSSL